MDPAFTLSYYERLVPRGSAAWAELAEALADELAAYAADLPAAVQARDALKVRRLRHAHRPLVINLGLPALDHRALAVAEALERGEAEAVWGPAAAEVAAEVQEASAALRSLT